MKKSNQTRPSDETKGAIELQEVHHRHMSFLFFSFFLKKKRMARVTALMKLSWIVCLKCNQYLNAQIKRIFLWVVLFWLYINNDRISI